VGKSKGGKISWMYYKFIYENGTMRPVETVLRRGEGIKEKDGEVNLRHIVSTFVNVTMCPGTIETC
jgi:hypothetical protein